MASTGQAVQNAGTGLGAIQVNQNQISVLPEVPGVEDLITAIIDQIVSAITNEVGLM